MNIIKSIFISALALSFGWGHRGQFGGQRGAMLPGALIGLALARISQFPEIQAVHLLIGAVGAIAFAFGGSMTYGQTLGLTHNEPKPDTYWWGLLGTTIKGSVWIGLGSIFIGMAAGWKPYSWHEIALLLLALVPCWFIGIKIFNRPMDPPEQLPRIYFSNRYDRPRTECWGGMWLSYIGLTSYLWFVRHDSFAVGLSLFGLIGGGLGFTLGQMAQAWGIHNRPFGKRLQRWIDWWKVMEMSFGAIAGGVLGGGWWWLESHLIREANHATSSTLLGTSGTLILPIASIGLWVVIYLIGSIGFHPLRYFMSIVCLYAIVPIAGSFGSHIWQQFILLTLLVWVSAENIAHYWKEKSLPGQLIVWIGASVLTIGTVGFMLKPLSFQGIWMWVLISQTFLSTIKVTAERFNELVRANSVGKIARVYGSALIVEVEFVLFVVFLSIIR